MAIYHHRVPRGALLALPALGLLWTLWSCDPSDAGTATPELIVAVAASQPTSPDDGTTVVLQQWGGTRLNLRTSNGSLAYTAGSVTDGAVTQSCVPAPPDGELSYLSVFPAQTECDLYVDLLGAEDDAGAAVDAGCAGTPLISLVIPVSTLHVNTTSAASSSSGGTSTTSSSSGAGGSSSSSSGAGGTSGTSASSSGSGGAGGGDGGA